MISAPLAPPVETRRSLAVLCVLLLLCAAACVWVFAGSLAPTARADAARPRVALPRLAPGEYAYVAHPDRESNLTLLFHRARQGELHVFALPLTEAGDIRMPDFHWWKPGPACAAFGIDTEAQAFRCLRPDPNDWIQVNLRWSLEGQALVPSSASMPRVRGHIEAGDYVLGDLTW